jgi:hypothetical protein
MLLVGTGFWRSAWAVLRHGRTNMDVLIALGASTALVASVVTFIAQRFGSLMDQPTWFSESAALLAIISIGHWMESGTSARAGAAVRELLARPGTIAGNRAVFLQILAEHGRDDGHRHDDGEHELGQVARDVRLDRVDAGGGQRRPHREPAQQPQCGAGRGVIHRRSPPSR